MPIIPAGLFKICILSSNFHIILEVQRLGGADNHRVAATRVRLYNVSNDELELARWGWMKGDL